MTKAVGRCLLAAAVVGGSILAVAPQAHAAPVEIVVTTVALEGPGSLREALETANSSSNADGVRIVFADGLAGGIEFTSGSADDSMYTEHVGNPSGQVNDTIGQNGARFYINADVPVEIDFANLPDGIIDVDGSHAAGIFIASNDVTLSNLSNLRAAEAAFAISGDNVTLDNVAAIDEDSSNLEAGVALLDGADATTINNSTFSSAYWSNILVDTGATISNTTINGMSSNSPQGYSHIIFEDGAIVNNFTLNGSTIGGVGQTNDPAFYLNPGNVITGLTITDTQFLTPGQDGFYFEGSNQVFNGATITGNTFAGTEDSNYGRPFGASNPVEWNNLAFNNNTIENAGGTVFSGSITDSQFNNNTFTKVDDGARAALQLGDTLSNVAVSGNTFNELWTLDTIRIEGDAEDVVIEDNTLNNLNASVSRAGIGIYAGGSGNLVRNNVLFQDLADESLRPDNDNHWAIWIDGRANAADADSTVGWQILNNSIDGYGGRDRSDAPIVNRALGKLLVTGNTFGVNTRTEADTDERVENNRFHMLWNLNGNTNHKIQPWRAIDVAYDGSAASFNVVRPDVLSGNTDATGPVTVHVYWTSSEFAEEYLGSIEEVGEGQRVSIPTDHTDGFLRLQIVDANGNTSQYSSLDPNPPVVTPALPGDVTPVENGASGTGTEGNGIVVRDTDGNTVAETEVDEDGNWSVDGLTCGTTYTVAQTNGDLESDPVEFTTADCPAPGPVTEVEPGQDGATGSGTPGASVIIRDADGNDVATAEVDEDGNWSVDGLSCATDYTATQVLGGVEGESVDFTTTACPVPVPGDVDITDDGTLHGTGEPGAEIVLFDEDGNEIATVTVDEDGNWEIEGLTCATNYAIAQVIDGVASDLVPFRVTCGEDDGNDDGNDGDNNAGGNDDGLADTGAPMGLGVAFTGLGLVIAGGAALLAGRRRA